MSWKTASSKDQFSYYKSSHNILASNDNFRTLNTSQITCLLQRDTLLITAPSPQRYIVQQPQSWWMQLWRETLCQDPPSSMIKDGSMVCQVPSRERIHIPPKREKENQHLQKCVGKGYVSSKEGMPLSSILSFGGISFQTSMLRALFSLRAGVKSNMRRCHLPRCPTRMLRPSFYSNQYINLMVSRLLHHPTTNETGSVKYLSLPFWSQHMTAFKPVKFYHLVRFFHVWTGLLRKPTSFYWITGRSLKFALGKKSHGP